MAKAYCKNCGNVVEIKMLRYPSESKIPRCQLCGSKWIEVLPAEKKEVAKPEVQPQPAQETQPQTE